MYPTLFTLGSTHISSFSIFLILGWCVASFVFWKSLRDDAVLEEHIFDLTFYGTITAFIASRVWFVSLHWENFSTAMIKIIALWVAPGLSLLAGVAVALGVMMMAARRMKIRLGTVLDGLGVALPGALIVGSVGSFLDGGSVGKVGHVMWAVRYVGLSDPRHPVQLYMIAALAFILIVVGIVSEQAPLKKWPLGSAGLSFFFLWPVAIFVLEFFKESDVYWYSLSADGWAALILFFGTLGVWYVYAGGKYVVMDRVQRARAGIIRLVQNIYAR
ncbi:MAG: prolipoprotein diacylglyceryl transferase [Candidatus Gottesmanbacteria bacterium]|nr:prolipoprotein diacylglyceryl transferase [Candidatus Gottesmanbacteria bacterium]